MTGGNGNAQTWPERTRYFRETLPSKLDATLDALAEVVVYPTLPPDRLLRERDVVIRENGGPDEAFLTLSTRFGVGELTQGELYRQLFPDSTLELRAIGTTDALMRISVDDLRIFHRTHYLPNNAHVVVVGAVDWDAVRTAAERAFGDWEARPLPDRPRPPQSAATQPIRLVQRGISPKDRAVVWIGARTEPAHHPDHPALSIMAKVLETRLFDRLRTQAGIVYGTHVRSESWSDGGDFRIWAEAATQHLDQIETGVREELAAMRSTPIPLDQLIVAKDAILTQRALAMESNLKRAVELLGRSDTPEGDVAFDVPSRIESVDAADLLRVANTYFAQERIYTALAKPLTTGRTVFVTLAGLGALLVAWFIAGSIRRRRATSTIGKHGE